MSSSFASGLKSSGGDGAFQYQWFGLIQNDWVWLWDDGGDYGSSANPGFGFRRVRLGANGTMYGNVKWHSEVDFAHGDVTFADMWIELIHCAFGNIRVGHQKEPIGFDQLTSDRYVQFMERSTVNSLSPGRNTGVMLHGRCMDDSILYQIGMFREANSAGDDLGNAKDGEYDFSGRVATRTMVQDDGTTWLHLGASGRYSDWADDTIGGSLGPAVAFTPALIGGSATSDDGWQYGLEAAYVSGPWTFLGEYCHQNNGGTGSFDFDLSAWSLEGAYWLTGENTAYDKGKGTFGRTAPKHNFGDGDGQGAWQIAVRFDTIDLDDGGDMDRWTFGVKWWLNPNTAVHLNVCRASPDTPFLEEDLTAVGVRFEIDF
jgi:phosphate-selective porin OprO/OprP